MARLTIGVPLYNNERTLLRALSSLEAQTFRDFAVLMSDDGSTDATVTLAQSVVARDARFSLVRQPVNLNYGNFRVLLNGADTEFFMFAAGDDYWDPVFVESCIRTLDENRQAVAAISRVEFFDQAPPRPSKDTFALTGTIEENLERYLRNAGDNSRMYGVFRTPSAKAAFPATDHYAYDWTFSAASLLSGTHVEVPHTLMFRETTAPERYIHYSTRDAKGFLDRVLPLRAMTASLLFEKRVPRSARVIRALAWANLRAHYEYAAAFHPRYERVASIFLSRLLRIL